jgi:hypothetical protein
MPKKASKIKSDSEPKVIFLHAPSSVVYQYYDLTNEIIIKILDLTPDVVYVTDHTQLDTLATSENIISYTKKHYGIELTEAYFHNNFLKEYVLMIVESQKSK